MRTFLQLSTVLLAFVLAAGAPAQNKTEKVMVPIPEKVQRATEKGEDGRLAWAKYLAEKCVNCKGRKTMQCQHCLRIDDHKSCPECKNKDRAPCRVCFAEGVGYDPLEKAPCPTCFGAGLTVCFICGGRGSFKITGSGDRQNKCLSCKSVGGFKCGTCKGKRWVAPGKFKPSFAEAKLKDLLKAQKVLAKVAADTEKFQSTRDGRKDMKAMAKILAPAAKYFPALKAAAKHFEIASKGQTKGSGFTKYADTVVAHTDYAKRNLDYYFKLETRMLQLAIERAKHNESVKGK